MPARPNVLFLIFDTLRPDFLGCYGGDVDTPGFDSVAANGVCFESAFGAGPATPVSHAALYSGRYPPNNGVTGQYIELPDDYPVMAEWFSDAGYETFGITGPAKMGSDWGYDRGFDELYEAYYDRPAISSADGLQKAVTDPTFARFIARKIWRGEADHTRYKFDLLREKTGEVLDEPFFALCNLTTVHAPYDPPRPYRQRFRSEYHRWRLAVLDKLLGERDNFADSDVRLDRVSNMQTGDGVGRFLADPSYVNDAEIELLRDWYAASVAYLDDELHRFLEFYRSELRDDTILVLTADHGEQLGEHDIWEHSHFLFDETVQVPLVLAGPGLPESEFREDLASHVDLFDTLCDLCGLDRPDETDGISLVGNESRDKVYMEYGRRDRADFANNSNHGRYMSEEQLERFCAGRKAIRTTRHRFELDSNGDEVLYELPQQTVVDDPSEDLVETLRERLLKTLGPEFGAWPEGDAEEVGLSQEAQANLRHLGYIE